jgi:hypothetical protein
MTLAGRRSAAPTPSLGNREIVHGLPGDDLTLRFTFPVGVQAYRKLISKPGLVCNCHA